MFYGFKKRRDFYAVNKSNYIDRACDISEI